MSNTILVTGSAGLIGRRLVRELRELGYAVREFDIRLQGDHFGDVRRKEDIRRAMKGVSGVVHLAAISRVIWGEQRPEECIKTNIYGLENTLAAALQQASPPWLIFASSREVYGECTTLPVRDDAPLMPVNIYGHTKVRGEKLVMDARAAGLSTAIVRLSNVFGCVDDHADRVVPAFVRAAVGGETLRVDGGETTFDFTHVIDITIGFLKIIELLSTGKSDLPPLHLVSGRPTTLAQLATLAVSSANSTSKIVMAPPRSFDVSHFYGCPESSYKHIGWRHSTKIEDGILMLIKDVISV
jgi:UDP-glucose 4-epimerase